MPNEKEKITIEIEVKKIGEGLTQLQAEMNRLERTVGTQSVQINRSFTGIKATIANLKTAIAGVGASMGPQIAGLLAATGIGMIGKQFLDTAASFEKFETTLITVLGSSREAKKAMDWITDFSAKTPYELQEVTDAFVKLSAYGFDASKYLKVLGDAASGMGKGLNEAVEAFADATTGEFERLKEFGVRTSVEGNKVVFSWMENGKQMQVSTQKTQDEISNALFQVFGRFEGGMARFSATWVGMWSNLKDQATLTMKHIMDAGLFEQLKNGLDTLLKKINELAENGTLNNWIEDISGKISFAIGVFQVLAEIISSVWRISTAFFSGIHEFFSNLATDTQTTQANWQALSAFMVKWGRNIISIFEMILKAVGEIFAFMVMDIGSAVKLIAFEFLGLAKVIGNALVGNISGAKAAWNGMVADMGGFRAEIQNNWTAMTTSVGNSWDKMVEKMKGSKAPKPKSSAPDASPAKPYVPAKPAVTGAPTSDNTESINKQIEALKTQAATYGKTAKEATLYKLALEGATTTQLKQAAAILDTLAAQDAQKKKEADIESAQKQIETLKTQAATYGMTAKETTLYKLALDGATSEQLKQAAAILDTLAAQDKLNQSTEEGKSIYESTRTATEKYAETIDKLNKLLSGNFISQDTYKRAVQQAGETLNQEAEKTKTLWESVVDAIDQSLQAGLFDSFKRGVGGMRGIWSEMCNTLVTTFLRAIEKMAINELLYGTIAGKGEGKASGGLMGWLGGLFGEKKQTAAEGQEKSGGIFETIGSFLGFGGGKAAITGASSNITTTGNININTTGSILGAGSSGGAGLPGATVGRGEKIIGGETGGWLSSLTGKFTDFFSPFLAKIQGWLSSLSGGISGLFGSLGSLFGGSGGFEGILSSIGGSLFAFAEGGWIPEPVLGKGLTSGRYYSFAERESERVMTKKDLGDINRSSGREAISQRPTLNARIINVLDPSIVGNYLATDAGEQIILNVVKRNQRALGIY